MTQLAYFLSHWHFFTHVLYWIEHACFAQSAESLGVETLRGLSSRLASIMDCHAHLLVLRSASTVMQYRIVMTGQRLWVRDEQAALCETFIPGPEGRIGRSEVCLARWHSENGFCVWSMMY